MAKSRTTADLVKALELIRDGLADTGSHRSAGLWMTKITKAEAHKIAADALGRAKGGEA